MLTDLDQGVCAAAGFRAAGVAAGIKRSGGLDLALVVSDLPAAAAGTFTTHRAAAAPVIVSRERVAAGSARGIVVNSGSANAMTGPRGRQDAETMAAEAAAQAGVDPAEMLVCSTGKIGSHLPMDRVSKGIAAAAGALGSGGTNDEDAARAILTTDTRPKRAAVSHPDGWRLGGMAKGAGMIAPDMATMLAFLTTDAVVAPDVLRAAVCRAVDRSFNLITVDGEPSTNDAVLALANGRSGLRPSPGDLAGALEVVCGRLAEAIVADGEGATKLVRVRVGGARSVEEARRAARSVADSPLVKCALYGEDANWGRVAAALAKSGAALDLDALSIAMGGVTLLDRGEAAGDEAAAEAHRGLGAREVEIACDLGAGGAEGEILTTDLSPGYVAINAEYEP
ncbi:MAG TPA: bifunctional glutamate N-acetyltransferase/amino-acid acetyltransferase ArgJ [Actinomycetota bacterium]|nr:bifunctional glutamate N-acetyltransferase/amino-acid acetyltransferase ArgJ [Actinomycetota bacterium]